MRVVQLYKDYPPVMGGVEKHLRDLARGLPRYGVKVTVVACSRDRTTRLVQDGPSRIILLPRHLQISSAPVSLAMLSVLRRLEADLVHGHLPYPPGELTALLSGRPLVCTYHSPIVRQRMLGALTAPVTRAVLKRARRLIVSNPVLAASLGGDLRARAETIPFGVDLERFTPAEQVQDSRVTRVLFLGRFRYYKGLPVLLEAMKSVPSAVLTLAGDGPLRPKLEGLSSTLGLEGRVAFTGDIDEGRLPDLYRGHDLFVLPSDRPGETFGIAMLEAMACGLPCISTELGTGTSWLNRHGETGLVVPPGDPRALAEAILQLSSNPELRRQMGAEARRRAEGFPLEKMLEATSSVYREVAG